jgi:hypothetical protein
VDIFGSVAARLKSEGASKTTIALWTELYEAFEEGGPEAVRLLLTEKVRQSRKRADKEVRGMRLVAGTVATTQRKPTGRR